MKWLRALCAAAAALVLAGCTARQSIEELLRAPQPNEAQSAVQAALTSYLGEALQLKYPRGGSEMAPLLFSDFDGDGEDEAAALYVTEAKGTDVHLAILENRDGGWQVVYEIAGLGSEVASVEEAKLLGEGVQLIVGYANTTLTDKYLAVYSYRADSVVQLYTCAYTSYLSEDIFDGGGTELAVVLPVTQASVDIAVLAETAGGVGVRQMLSLGEEFVSCDGLYVTRSGQRTGLIADGASSDEGRVSELFVVNNDYLLSDALGAPQMTRRPVSGLAPTDFDGLGAYELPVEIEAVNTINYARRFYFVVWQDLLGSDWSPDQTVELPAAQTPAGAQEEAPPDPASASVSGPASASGSAPGEDPSSAPESAPLPAQPEPEPTLGQMDVSALEQDGVRFGVYDATNGCFLRLPLAWRGRVVLADGTLGDWLVRDAATNEVLATVRTVDRDETVASDSYALAGATEDKKVYVNVPSRVNEDTAKIILKGFSLIQ